MMRARILFLIAAVACVAAASDTAVSTQGLDPHAFAPPDSDWWSQVSRQLEQELYSASLSAEGLRAANRAQALSANFQDDGIEVTPRRTNGGPWQLRWHTTHWGREGAMRQAGPARRTHDGPRVAYARSGITEWYENRPDGIEQGFTVTERLDGNGPLRVEGSFDASLRAVLNADADAVEFSTDAGERVLRYEKLVVWDAQGASLPAHMELEGLRLALVVDDTGARYPITVDPVLNTPDWTVVEPQAGSDFGFSVATAGDVNGDGFSDVVVGAPDYANGEDEEGKVFVYHGSPTGLSTTPSWTTESNVVNAGLGYSVATAGDVNNDGFDDLIVGAPWYENGASAEGAAFLFMGSSTGLSSAPAWTMEGDSTVGLGVSVATAGDVNGDGFADVIVGAWIYTNGQTNEGQALIFHGSVTGLKTFPQWTFESDNQSAYLGRSVATAGDVNADGYDDVIVAAPNYTNGQSQEGAVYVFHGSPVGVDAAPAWMRESNSNGSNLGSDVSTAGDYNGDGYADVVIGQSDYSLGQTNEGRVYVYLGSAAGVSANPAFTHESNQQNAFLGYSVGTAGDIDGDGFGDIVVAAPRFDILGTDEGLVFVFKGNAQGAFNIIWQGSPIEESGWFGWSVGTAGDTDGDGYSELIIGSLGTQRASVYAGYAWTLSIAVETYEGNQNHADMGWSVAGAGDVNGDGFDDVIVGAPGYDNGRGRAFLYLGYPGGITLLPEWVKDGPLAGSAYGACVASAGDVNGDGYDDVIVGAPEYSNLTLDGAAYVYHGSPTGLSTFAQQSMWGTGTDTRFGQSVAGAGDVNGDGYSDVIIGAPSHTNNYLAEGRAMVHLGSPNGVSPFSSWTREGNATEANFGESVGTAGDVNGDGYSDIIIGAPFWTYMHEYEGAVYVFHGGSTGLENIGSWFQRGDQELAVLGFSVGTAGDVNGDGYSDVIVGAPGYTNGHTEEGMAYVYHGSASGLELAPAWENDGDQIGSSYAFSASTAGDVDGDGYSDVIVGAFMHDLAEPDEGVTFFYTGSPAGLNSAQDVSSRFDSDQDGAWFGKSVAPAGDVNGDGFADVIIGAPRYSNPNVHEGRAYVHLGNKGDGLHRCPVQAHPGDRLPIATLGPAESDYSVLLKAHGRSAAGRGRVQMEVEVKEHGVPFDGTGTFLGVEEDTGPAGSGADLFRFVTNLEPDRLYKWRMRLHTNSPLFPQTQWFYPSGNAPTEPDFRTVRTNVDVAAPEGATTLLLNPAAPNPFRARTQISFELPREGRVQLVVHDIAGRELVRLHDGNLPAGTHVVTWNGRNAMGSRVAPGVYFARLAFGGTTEFRKITLTQ